MSENYSEKVQKLLNFEKRHCIDLMTYQIQGLHLYPIIRTHLLRSIRDQVLDNNKIIKREIKIPSISNKLIKILYWIATRSTQKIRNKKILFITHNHSRRTKSGLRYSHRIVDNLVTMLESSDYTVLENFTGFFKIPQTSIKNLVLYKISKKKYHLDSFENKIIKNFLKNIHQLLLNIEIHNISLERYPELILKTLQTRKNFHLLFKKYPIQSIFIDDLCYGGLNIGIVKAAKENHIKVFEYQHGMIDSGHLAYSYKVNKEYSQNYLPDKFFTFGNYWSESLTLLDCPKISLGYPQYFELPEQPNKANSDTLKILIVGADDEDILKIALKATKKIKNTKVMIKLHPNFTKISDEVTKYLNNDIKIYINQNIYPLLSQSDIVICEYSTVAFESIIFKNKLFIMKTGRSDLHIPPNLGERFKNEDELFELLSKPTETENYKENYFFNFPNTATFLKAIK